MEDHPRPLTEVLAEPPLYEMLLEYGAEMDSEEAATTELVEWMRSLHAGKRGAFLSSLLTAPACCAGIRSTKTRKKECTHPAPSASGGSVTRMVWRTTNEFR